jgi:hypothetical protein
MFLPVETHIQWLSKAPNVRMAVTQAITLCFNNSHSRAKFVTWNVKMKLHVHLREQER